eukprot:350464-Chlamydomonas_euryale.AAC.2
MQRYAIQRSGNAMQCNAMQCNAMQCNAMQRRKRKLNAMHYRLQVTAETGKQHWCGLPCVAMHIGNMAQSARAISSLAC